MKNKILSLSECKKACDDEYNSDINYVNVYESVVFWLQKKQTKQKVNSKINNKGGKNGK